MRAFAWGTSYSVRYKMFCGGFEAADKSRRRRRLVAAGNKKVGIADGNAARTCKKLPVASFCASETAETGRIANGREQGDHVSRRSRVATLWTPGTIQSSAGSDFAKSSSGFCRNRFCLQNGGEKALNRCDVPVLQRKDLERTSKEQPCSLRTVGYGWVGIRGV